LIRIEERMQQLAGAWYGGMVAGGGLGTGLGVGLGVGLGALGSVLFATLVPIGALAGSFALARHFFGKVSRKRRKTLTTLLDRLTDLVEGSALPPSERLEPPSDTA